MKADSSTTGKPPSSDPIGPRKKRAERRAEAWAAKRRPGKQPGAPGANLQRRYPGTVVPHRPPKAPCCEACGADLAAAEMVATRYVKWSTCHPWCRSSPSTSLTGGCAVPGGPRPWPASRPRQRVLCATAAGQVRRLYQQKLAELLNEPLDNETLKRRELLRRLDVVGLRLGEAADALADGVLKRSR